MRLRRRRVRDARDLPAGATITTSELAEIRPGPYFPATVEEHRLLLALLEAELKSALATIAALHRCPSCGRALHRGPE